MSPHVLGISRNQVLGGQHIRCQESVDRFYSSLHNRVSKILHLNVGFVLKLTVLYFIDHSRTLHLNSDP